MIAIILAILLGFLIAKQSWISVLLLIILFLNELSQGGILMVFEEIIDEKTRYIFYIALFLFLVIYIVI